MSGDGAGAFDDLFLSPRYSTPMRATTPSSSQYSGGGYPRGMQLGTPYNTPGRSTPAGYSTPLGSAGVVQAYPSTPTSVSSSFSLGSGGSFSYTPTGVGGSPGLVKTPSSTNVGKKKGGGLPSASLLTGGVSLYRPARSLLQKQLKAKPEESFLLWLKELRNWCLFASCFWLALSFFPFSFLLSLLSFDFWSGWSMRNLTWGSGISFVFFLFLLLYTFSAWVILSVTEKRKWYTKGRNILFLTGNTVLIVPFMFNLFLAFKSDHSTNQIIGGWWGNEGSGFVWMVGMLTGVVHSISVLRSHEYLLSFPVINQGRIFRLKAAVPKTISKSFLSSLLFLPLFYLLIFVNDYFQRWSGCDSGVECSSLMESIPKHFLSFSLFIHLLAASTFVHFCLLTALNFLKVFHTQNVEWWDRKEGCGAQWLIWGLALRSNDWARYLAFLNLRSLVFFDPNKRFHIFENIDDNLWLKIMDECLGNIDSFTQSVQKVNDILGQDVEKKRPKMKLRKSFAVEVKEKKKKGFLDSWKSSLDSLKHSFTKKTRDEYVTELFVHFALLRWSIECVGYLTCKSSKEDTYGIVQTTDGVQKVITSLLSCLLLLEEFSGIPEMVSSSPIEGHQVLFPQVDALDTVLRNSIYQLVGTFYEHLAEFEFPEKHAAKLQSFVDFHE